MTQLSLSIEQADGTVKAEHQGEDKAVLVYKQAYEEGDVIVLNSSESGVYLVIQLEDTIPPAYVYLKGNTYRYPVPPSEKRVSYSPKSFTGGVHVLQARLATEDERAATKNLAYNSFDQSDNEQCFPHASANVQTRGESVFAPRNAINGNTISHSHGPWPFESWGINQRADAAITVHFGRTVEVESVALTLRADFPHDNYWTQATLTFSDGSKQVVHLEKSGEPQSFAVEPKSIEWVTLSELIPSNDPSPFPALTQIEVYGRD
ncbi:carbohydrate-binding protein [Paenibacillus sp. JSM ZJ436]|uniref:carbohydrate-binding protein n=1 Tax=Paenibacillus sp. JSM ZJ436 TaxID=3376190 RepID=UPI0037897B1E